MKPLEIGIERLSIDASVGIYSPEKQAKQNIFISARLFFNAVEVEIDDMQKSVNYDTLSDEIRRIIGLRHYELIENIALHVGLGLKALAKCGRVRVRVDKPLAAQKNGADTIYVVVES